MTLTDTHCHLDYHKFDEDREAVIQRAADAGLARILIPALHWTSSLAAVKLAASHPMIYAAVGFHPTDLDTWDASSIGNLRELAQSAQKIVAIGEIGLDYYWVKEADRQARQREAFQAQLALAREVNLPVVVHMREAEDAWFGPASVDLLDILGAWQAGLAAANHPLAERPGVLHSFNGTLDTAQKALALNFHIGVTGPVTYKNAEQKRQVISQLPLERLLIETDAPFLAPVPHRGKRNEPAFVHHIADKIAEIHSKHPAEVADIMTRNASRLFAWGD
ncbi:MAG: TatD family hydrolase [Chloroflexi bacterium]|nr:TatD family hydrolase [Chloroflexota bacterium]